MKYKNVIWVSNFNTIGGVETFAYEMAKKYGHYDVTVMYRSGSLPQLKRLSKLVRVVKWNGEEIVCDIFIGNADTGIMDYVTAKHCYCVIHADFRCCEQTPPIHSKFDRYIAVSKAAADGFKEVTGIDAEVCYNPLTMEKSVKVLRLISCTRLTKDKGGKRMEMLANRLTEAGIPFIWMIYTNSEPIFKNPNVIFMPPLLEGMRDRIADSDYLVQLSDSEAYSYSMVEALAQNVAVITTPFPAANEIGVKNGVTGYIVPYDMKDVPVDDLYNRIPKFDYEIKEDRWCDYMAKAKSTYAEEQKAKYRVRANENYVKNNITDALLGRIPQAGEEFIVTGERLQVLLGQNSTGTRYVEVIEKIKEDKPKTKRKEERK